MVSSSLNYCGSEISQNGTVPGTEYGLNNHQLLLLLVIGSALVAAKVVGLGCLGNNYKMINRVLITWPGKANIYIFEYE